MTRFAGRRFGVEEIVRFVDVNVRVEGGVTRREKITSAVANQIAAILDDIAFHFEPTCNFEERFSELRRLSSIMQTLTLGGLHDPDSWMIRLLFNTKLQVETEYLGHCAAPSQQTANVVTPTTTSHLRKQVRSW